MEPELISAIALLATEAHKIEANREGTIPTFELRVSFELHPTKKVVARLSASANLEPKSYTSTTIEAASLEELVAEMKRRMSFHDRTMIANEATDTLWALPKPEVDDEIPY